jgi:lipopolysaccharide export LptBFGC system permease protein LptF
MSCILYYSNYCDHSKKLLQHLSKANLTKDIHFICIDVRESKEDGNIYIKLQNKEMILPKTITKVPALLLLKNNYQVLFGEDIYNYFKPKQAQQQVQATLNNLEPSAFSFSSNQISSDNYSFLDMDSEQLSAKGNGGMRQLHNYFSITQQSENISTPSEDFSNKETNKNNISLEQLRKQRELDILKK